MDLERLRAETPGCAERIHLNNAGAAFMPTPVVDVLRAHLDLECRLGGYEAADERAEAIDAAYGAVAELIGAQPENIAFTENATASYVQALSSIPFERDDLILTTRNDYVSNQIQFLSLHKRLGVRAVHAPDQPEGGVDPAAMGELIDRERPKLACVTHIPTNSGLIQDVAAVGAKCREAGVMYLVDACQSVGHLDFTADDLGCDFLSATSRKYLRGPRGAGFLWVSDRVLQSDLEPLFIDMRGADWIDADRYRPAATARRFENWEFAWALVLATAEAARYATTIGIGAIEARTRGLAERLRPALSALDGIRVLDRGSELSGIVTVAVEGLVPAEVERALFDRGINVRAQGRVDAVIDYDDKGVDGSVRISPHYYNTEGEIDEAVAALAEVLAAGRA